MTYQVYILYSANLQKYYVGHTDNLNRRIAEHNSGKGIYTAKGIPWTLVKTFECSSRSEAMLLESKIKARGIKRFLADINKSG